MAAKRPYSRKGFQRTATLVERQIRKVGETRGFAVSRLLTHWAEIVGPDLAAIARPVDVSYARSSMGATLTVLTTGAQAPMLQMQAETLRARVNACYGYAAIRKLRITQTAPTGFSDGAVAFGHAPQEAPPRAPDPATRQIARETAAPINDPGLRAALERLAGHVLDPAKKS